MSSVLYANLNHPELKTEFPGMNQFEKFQYNFSVFFGIKQQLFLSVWSDRCKQISKKWKALPQDQKSPILTLARENRTKLSRGRKAHQVCVLISVVKFSFSFRNSKISIKISFAWTKFPLHRNFYLRLSMLRFFEKKTDFRDLDLTNKIVIFFCCIFTHKPCVNLSLKIVLEISSIPMKKQSAVTLQKNLFLFVVLASPKIVTSLLFGINIIYLSTQWFKYKLFSIGT